MVFLIALGFTDTGNALAEAVGDAPIVSTVIDDSPTQEELEEAAYQLKLQNQRKATRKWQKSADRWGHKLNRHVRHAVVPPTQSLKYEQYRTRQWMKVSNKLRVAYKKKRATALMWAEANKDFNKALKLASKRYGVSYRWLHACAHSEGHIHGRRTPGGPIDPFIMNHGGSGAGGWMQFMESTFYGYVNSTSGYPVQYKHWKSKVGQAFVAAYMFKIGESNQWTGAGC